MDPDTWIDQLVELIAPRLIQRGFVHAGHQPDPTGQASSDYDLGTCRRYLTGHHLGDSVLRRAEVL